MMSSVVAWLSTLMLWAKEKQDGRVVPLAIQSAPDWTRTSTLLRAQALNLSRIPIPPRGHIHLLRIILG